MDEHWTKLSPTDLDLWQLAKLGLSFNDKSKIQVIIDLVGRAKENAFKAR